MVTRTSLVVLLLASLAVSCGPGQCLDLKELSYKLTRPDVIEAGKETKVVLTIANKSGLFMLVRNLSGKQLVRGRGDAMVGSESGALTPSKDGAAWTYDPAADDETPPVFAWGLIPPGSHLKVEVPILPAGEDATFTAHYLGLSAQEVSQWVFFERSRGAGGGKRTFKRMSASEVEKAGQDAAEGKGADLFKTVILHEKLSSADARCAADLPYKFSL